MTDEKTAAKLYGSGEQAGKTPTAATDATKHPYDEAANKLYQDTPPQPPAVVQALAQHHDPLTNVLNLDRAGRERLVSDVANAVEGAGFGLYDQRLFSTLLDGVVQAEVDAVRGLTDKDARDQAQVERYEELVREQRSVYGDDQYEDLMVRTNRWLKTQPSLAAVVSRARAGNTPTVVRALVEFVRAGNLGRR
jgi:hypothetical protein